jgi:hypothetical protein
MNNDLFENEPDAEEHANRVEFSDTRNQLAVQMLKKVRDSITHVIQLLEQGDSARATRQLVDLVTHNNGLTNEFEEKTGSRVIEGVFDGETMVGADGARYQVPENYASKSRLVEGDILKLTIQPEGTYVYKQIGPVERKRIFGKLGIDPSTQKHVVASDDRVYKVLTASVTYFKAIVGDEVVVVVPRSGESDWAAVESVVRNE